ncbi:MAG TPA: HAD family hydrolase [Candidatus Woesearchaeota archaeon]|nr:HAD family hydrolase [Candidatus Woesearchaeota archaeon]
MIKGVIFDFWGTLVENGIFPSPVRQAKYILRLRIPFHEFIIKFEKAMMTKPYKDLNEAFRAVCEEFHLEPSPFLIERLVGMWNKNELLAKPFLETMSVLDYLKEKKMMIGLISNTPPTITRIIDKFNLNKYFDTTLFSYDAGLLKTDPEMFKRLLRELKLEPEEALMIGDSIPTDIHGARAAGIRAVLLDRRNRRDFSPKIINLKELKDLIEKKELEEFIRRGEEEQRIREEEKADKKKEVKE